MEISDRFDVIVIGQGFAGLTAAGLAADRGLRTATIEAAYAGGWIMNINELDPTPEDAVQSGAELASGLAMTNVDKGVVDIMGAVTALERKDDSWLVKTDSETYAASNVIIASGARLRRLGVPGEQEFLGNGISECADCDGPLYAQKETVVVGGGDSAFQEALTLSRFARKVTIVLRGSSPRARIDLVERAAANPKIVQLTHTRVIAIQGAAGTGVEGVEVEGAGTGKYFLPANGIFIFIGMEPNTSFLPSELERDEAGALITTDECATAFPGLWAIGSVRSGYGGLLTHAAEDAKRAVAAF